MLRTSRSATTAGVALLGSGLIAVTQLAAPPPIAQHRPVRLVDVEQGNPVFPEVGYNDLVANTTANWNGLMELYDKTTNIFSLSPAVYEYGFTQVFNDLAAQIQTVLSGGTVTDPYADAVLNPVSLVTLSAMDLINPLYADNAALVGLAGIAANIKPALTDIGQQLQAALHGGSLTPAELSAIQADFTPIVNYLELAPTTVLNDYLNGYPVVGSAPDPILQSNSNLDVSNAYTLNAPFTSTTNDLITPEYGLLTNPYAADTVATDAGNTVPLQTGTFASLLQIEQTFADELQTVAASAPGSGVTAPPTVDASPLEGPNTVTLGLAIQDILKDLLNFDGTVSKSIDIAGEEIGFCASLFDGCSGYTIDINVGIPTDPSLTIPAGSIDGPTVPAYTYDLGQDDLGLAGSIGPLAAPVTGTVDSDSLGGNLLAPDPVMNLAGTVDQFLQSILGGYATLALTAPLNISNDAAALLNTLFTA